MLYLQGTSDLIGIIKKNKKVLSEVSEPHNSLQFAQLYRILQNRFLFTVAGSFNS